MSSIQQVTDQHSSQREQQPPNVIGTRLWDVLQISSNVSTGIIPLLPLAGSHAKADAPAPVTFQPPQESSNASTSTDVSTASVSTSAANRSKFDFVPATTANQPYNQNLNHHLTISHGSAPLDCGHTPSPIMSFSKISKLPFVLPSDIAALSLQDLAKEAMRITKDAIRKEEEELKANARIPDTTGTEQVCSKSDSREVRTSPTPSRCRTPSPASRVNSSSAPSRLNKFVRRLYEMVSAEQNKGVVEWRRGLLVLHSTATFAKQILPRFFNTRNFKTFRRQLNYYGFVHVRSFSNTAASTTTALWVHQDMAATLHNMAKNNHTSTLQSENSVDTMDPDNLDHILKLRRVEPNDDHKTVEGRRHRKEMALITVEEDLQVSTKSLQRQQIQSLLNISSGSIMAFSSPETTQPLNEDQPVSESPSFPDSFSNSTDEAQEEYRWRQTHLEPCLTKQQEEQVMLTKRSIESSHDFVSFESERSFPPKNKKARLASICNESVVDSLCPTSFDPPCVSSSAAVVVPLEEVDEVYGNYQEEEEDNPPTKKRVTKNRAKIEQSLPILKPPKTENSVANLLLLLSRAA